MKQLWMKSGALCFALVLTTLLACKKDPQDPTLPEPAPQQPNPIPENALLEKIKWSENDHYTITYNDQHQPLKMVYQWQYVQNDPTKIRTVTYDFHYNQQGLLDELYQSGGFTIKYFYQNGLIQKTQEFYPGGAMANETEYIYDRNRIVQENYLIYASSGELDVYYRRFLKYDAKGNLIREETVERQDNMTFVLLQTIEYSNFDQKINPTQWLLRFPYLPKVRWQFNNPGKEVVTNKGNVPLVYHYVHEYSPEGLPVSRTEIKPNGTLKADFEYQQ